MPSRTLAISANTGWYIANFAQGLIRGLSDAGYRLVIVAPEARPGEAAACAAELGVEWVVLGIDRAGLNPLADLRLLREYRSILKQLRPLAYLGFTIKPNLYGSLAARSLGIPSIANINGLGTAFIRGGALERLVTGLYRAALRHRQTVFFHNPDDRSLFIARNIVTAAQARLVPGSGIDLKRFPAAPLPDGPLRFLLIGRMLRDKGVREFVEAGRMLRAELPQARFQLLGGIDEGNRTAIGRDELDSWIAEGIVDYLGETGDVRPFIANASVAVLPSYREGLPRALLEAAAMGRPLIATDVPGCREVVEEGVNGLLCAARDSADLAGAMREMAGLPRAALEAMAAASRHKVQERFSAQRVVRAYLDVLDGIESA